MSRDQRLVLDTNLVVSGLLFAGSQPHLALLKAQGGTALASEPTLLELIEVMSRPRFDRYVAAEIRQRLVAEYIARCEVISTTHRIRACRDPKDDKFLEVAVNGQADAILTGDADLLALHPFRGIAILTPEQFLQRE